MNRILRIILTLAAGVFLAGNVLADGTTNAPAPLTLADAQQLALQTLANLREQQASALAYFDVFWVLAVVMVALVFVVLLMKRSVAEKGARIGGE